ncbi:MAG TPA: hypothetical protein VMD30_07815 [Tepidisphaeraceae bacterium]|nr:hypothetical protein [Tepidisphaeraceae bacterium]
MRSDHETIPSAELIEFLHEHDEPCPVCQYNLRNLQTDRCPECGLALTLKVTTAEPYLGPWVTALAASSAVGAIGLFFLTIVMPYPHDFSGFFDLAEAPARAGTLYLFLAQIPLAIALLVRRRWFTGLGRGVQRRTAILWLILDVTAFIVLAASFRFEP